LTAADRPTETGSSCRCIRSGQCTDRHKYLRQNLLNKLMTIYFIIIILYNNYCVLNELLP